MKDDGKPDMLVYDEMTHLTEKEWDGLLKRLPKKDPKYLKWIRQRPCIFEGPMCDGPIEAHHRTGAGLALKAPDRDAIPLCRRHHAERHRHAGPFHKLTKAERKAWEADMVATYQALYDADNPTEF
jgi:hypothetical protein